MVQQMREIDGYVGERLRAFRQSRRLSLDELGRRIGVSYQQIQKYELGTNRISASQLWRLSKALRIGVGAFLPTDSDAPSSDILYWSAAIDRLDPEMKPILIALIDAIPASPAR